MNSQENPLKKARQGILVAFHERHLDGDVLRQFIAHAQSEKPEIFESYRADPVCPDVDLNPVHWKPDYYSRQLLCAGFNFSRRRLDHLIDVREYFRQQGYKGFTPQPPGSQTGDMGTNSQANQSGNAAPSWQPSGNLQKFVERGDMDTIRAALRFELEDNRTSREHMLEALNWTSARVKGFCDPYVEKDFAGPMNPDRNHWTVEYYDRQTVYLDTNFAAERFHHLVDVRMHLRERGTKGFVPTNNAIGDTARSDARKAAAANAAEPAQLLQGARVKPTSRSENSSSLMKIALLVGGALAAAVILLTLVK